MNEPIWIKEHEVIPQERQAELSDIYFQGTPDKSDPIYLGIDSQYRASYYVGASWLKVGELAVAVMPKMDNVDFIQMFSSALSVDSSEEIDYFTHCYGIDIDDPPIKLNQKNNLLTPLLVVHYLTLLERIIRTGVKRGYRTQVENLHNKVKGHVLLKEHFRSNIITKRIDRAFCRFEEYTEDIPENRLLKRALLVADRMARGCESIQKHGDLHNITMRLNRLKVRFDNISEEITFSQVHNLPVNKLYKGYKEATRIATLLLNRYGYSLNDESDDQGMTPPFWIDMARLYEMYVYSKLNKAYPGQIAFQVAGYYCTAVDFIKKDEQLIMDTKYKPRYKDSNKGIIDDVRQISGYARDYKILKELGVDGDTNREVKCLIIYPDTSDGFDDISEFHKEEALIKNAKMVNGFRNIYKINVVLPTIK